MVVRRRPAPPRLRIADAVDELDAGDEEAVRAHPGERRLMQRREWSSVGRARHVHACDVGGAIQDLRALLHDEQITAHGGGRLDLPLVERLAALARAWA